MLGNWARAAGFVAIFGAVIVCTFVWAISYRPLTSEGPVAHHYDSTAAAENNPSNQDQRGTRSVPLIVETVDPPEGTPERERLEKERQEKAANERGLTVATWVVASATCFLFFATGLLGIATFIPARAARDAANYVRLAERAQIHGGWGGQIKFADDPLPAPASHIFANLNNLGKTHGFVTRIAVAVRPAEGLPDEPEYPPGIRPGFILGPDTKGFAAHGARAWWDGTGGQVFYGRIWFTDVFNPAAVRFSSFILNIPDWTAVMDRPRYWDIGEEHSAR